MNDLSIAVGTGYEGGIPTTQIQPVSEGGHIAPATTMHAFGFLGCPRDPEVDAGRRVYNGALVLHWSEGNTLHTIRLDDFRRTKKLPILPKGSSIQYADVDNAYALFSGDDGSYKVVVPTGQKAAVGGNKTLALGQALSALKTALKVFATACKAAAVEPALPGAGTALETALDLITEIETIVITGA